jgi:hypothetical protein
MKKSMLKPTLDDLKFDLKGGNYRELSETLEYWAEQFFEGCENNNITEEDQAWHVQDAYGDCIAYLMYNISKEMKHISIAEEE